MGLGNGYSIENVAKSVLVGTLTEYGEILTSSAGRKSLASKMPSFCNPDVSLQGCREAVLEHLRQVSAALFLDEFNSLNFENYVTAFTVYLANLGYSGRQIAEALHSMFGGGEVRIKPWADDRDFPFGGIQRKKQWQH